MSREGIGLGRNGHNVDRERQRKRYESQNGKRLHNFILLGVQKGIVGFSQFIERISVTFEVIVNFVILTNDCSSLIREIGAEKPAGGYVKRLQNFFVKVGRPPHVKKLATHFGNSDNHGPLATLENVLLNGTYGVVY